MATIEIKVPQLSESVSEGTLLQWKKKVGDSVTRDEILVEIETDKVVLEVPAPSSGTLATLVHNDGDTVLAEEVIGTIDSTGKAAAAAPVAAAAAPKAAAPAAAPAAAAPAAAASTAVAAAPAARPSTSPAQQSGTPADFDVIVIG